MSFGNLMHSDHIYIYIYEQKASIKAINSKYEWEKKMPFFWDIFFAENSNKNAIKKNAIKTENSDSKLNHYQWKYLALVATCTFDA